MAVIGTFWVGQIPGDPLSIQVRDENNTPVNLSSYTTFKVIIVDTNNKEVQLEDDLLDTGEAMNGRFVFNFPKNRSLFDRQGDYLFQIEMSGAGKLDMTSPFTMRVRQLGRSRR